jgi:hypothetical protein
MIALPLALLLLFPGTAPAQPKLSTIPAKLHHVLTTQVHCGLHLRRYFLNAFRKTEAQFFSYTENEKLARILARLQKSPVRTLTRESERVAIGKFLDAHSVSISLTTSPKRIHELENVLSNLDLENIKNIIVSLPERFGRDQSEYVIPEWLSKHPKVKILRFEKDEGPISKLLPAIDYLKRADPESYLITIDDDVGYPMGMVKELITAAASYPEAVIAGSGQNFRFYRIKTELAERMRAERLATPLPSAAFSVKDLSVTSVEVVEGYGGILYPVKKVNEALMRKFSALSREAYTSDDLVISVALGLSGVLKLALNTPFFSPLLITPLPQGFGEDALHRGGGLDPSAPGNEGKYLKTIQHIEADLAKGER